MRVRIGSTQFVAVGTPVDDQRTWVAANYHPADTKRVAGLRKVEAWLAMFVDLKLFQRQDRAIFEGLGSTPSPLEYMNLMPADVGAELWIRRLREMLDTRTASNVPVEVSPSHESQRNHTVAARR
jgi:hypothetical protein